MNWIGVTKTGTATDTEQEKRKRQSKSREKRRRNTQKKMLKDYCPTSPVYDPMFKQDDLPYCGSKEKQILDPHCYPQNYESHQKEDSPTLVDNLIPSPVNIEEDQEEKKQDGGDTKEEKDRQEEDRKEDVDKTQADNSGQEEDEDDY